MVMLLNPRVHEALEKYHITPVDFSFVKTWSQN
jgi:hypothetical protein